MIVDAIDAIGRRYQVVDGLPKWDRPWDPDEPCEECGVAIQSKARFYMRNEAADGSESDSLEAMLMALTYDTVCAACGDRAIRGDSV